MRTSLLVSGILALLYPAFALAFPFGGQASTVVPCYNQAIYANLGAPRGGPYVWTPSTKTYQFGAPTHAGQWLLGLAGAPYYCIVSIQPVIVWPGTYITMMGSSGPAAPVYAPSSNTNPFAGGSGGTGTGSTGTGSTGNTGGGTGGSGTSGIGHIVVSEVFYNVDATHGTKPQNEWVELYNGSNASVDLSGWILADDGVARTIPNGVTLSAGGYLVVTNTNSTVGKWSIPSTARVLVLGVAIGNGLANAGDVVTLKNTSGTLVDVVSWGTNPGLSPSVSSVASGHATMRRTLASDSDTASDWIDTPTPTPGR